MKRQYTNNSGVINRLLNLLGIIFAIAIIIGALDQAGVRILLPSDGGGPHMASAMSPHSETKNNQSDEVIVVSADPGAATISPYDQQPMRRQHTSRPPSTPTSDAGEWIDRFASSARSQALKRGVPAGLALAVGVQKMEQGASINDWEAFVAQVIAPLVRIKQSASRNELSQYFKYSANSQRWITGLDATGHYSGQQLQRIVRQYDLEAEDKAVMAIITGDGSYEQATKRRAATVADEVTTRTVTRTVSRQEQESQRSKVANSDDWEQYYDEVVGHAVAKEVAKKKLKSGQYISDSDMEALIDETNEETGKILERNISFLGRKINPDHPDAANMKDITNPRNAQAREELYQRKLREEKVAKKWD